MGGIDNYEAEDQYNLDDTWDERRQDLKPKTKVYSLVQKFFCMKTHFKIKIRLQRFTNSLQESNPNIYDSWRSQNLQRYQTDEFYYDSHDPFNELQPKHHQHQNPYSSSKRFMEPGWVNSDYPPYQEGNSSHNYNSRRLRDYDQHF